MAKSKSTKQEPKSGAPKAKPGKVKKAKKPTKKTSEKLPLLEGIYKKVKKVLSKKELAFLTNALQPATPSPKVPETTQPTPPAPVAEPAAVSSAPPPPPVQPEVIRITTPPKAAPAPVFAPQTRTVRDTAQLQNPTAMSDFAGLMTPILQKFRRDMTDAELTALIKKSHPAATATMTGPRTVTLNNNGDTHTFTY